MRGLEYTCLTLKVSTELQELITYVSYLYIRWKLEGFNCARNRNYSISRWRTGVARSRHCAPVPRNLESHCVNPVRNLEMGTQFRDSESAQRNLEIALIRITTEAAVEHARVFLGPGADNIIRNMVPQDGLEDIRTPRCL